MAVPRNGFQADGVEGEPDLSTEGININIRGVHFHL